jgi:S-formylglutathione hydrolase FrmB
MAIQSSPRSNGVNGERTCEAAGGISVGGSGSFHNMTDEEDPVCIVGMGTYLLKMSS